ncbi:MAG: DUF2520 domain-containing protein [Candidatus Kapaibacteriales bacterium]
MRKFSIVGYGKLGKALSKILLKKNLLHSIISKHLGSTQEVKIFKRENVNIFEDFREEVFESDVFMISTKEEDIKSIVDKIITNFSDKVKAKIFIHHAGIYGKEILSDLQHAGAHTSSAHPLQTFYFFKEGLFDDIYWIVDGDEKTLIAEVISEIGGKIIFWDGDQQKRGLYHSSAVISSNVIGSILFFVKHILNEIDLQPNIFIPLIRQTIENYFLGEDESSFPLTGPIARKNFDVVEQHFQAFKSNFYKLGIYYEMVDLLIKISHYFSIIDEGEKEKFLQHINGLMFKPQVK